jgi:16S rRNA (cytosine1402-N4)-methyltransferase
MGHVPVMLAEVLEVLAPAPGQVLVDCTAGLGGHAAGIAPRLSGGMVVLNDVDEGNLKRAAGHVCESAAGVRVEAWRGNFAELPSRVEAASLRADLVLADLGFASTQVDDPGRGLSFSREGPLDMRLDDRLKTTAADLVASLPEAELARILETFGEERNARRIARKLVQTRGANPILTTTQLAEAVRAVTGKGGRIDPATRTFQALRIAVNDEIGSLEALLEACVRDAGLLAAGRPGTWLAGRARLAFLSFHSLEDRPVKQAVARIVALGGQDLCRGARSAGEAEVTGNARARSAKLRAVELPGS